jgi:hypothetical protein
MIRDMRARAIILAALAAACCATTGCSETYQRVEGVTPGAGDAVAANTVMQMVDPWPYGAQDTDLSVPADRSSQEEKAQASSEIEQSPSTTGN